MSRKVSHSTLEILAFQFFDASTDSAKKFAEKHSIDENLLIEILKSL